MLTATLKPKKCKSCHEQFMPKRRIQPACSPDCEHKLILAKVEKAARKRQAQERKETREKLESLKTPTELENDCKAIMQELARIRDRHDGCISCHMGPNYGGAWHGSHYRPAGNNSAVQFHLLNIHKACAQCNLFKGGNLSAYRPRLIEKIGLEKVEWLESQTQVVKRNVDYLVRFKVVMGKRLRRIKKQLKGETA